MKQLIVLVMALTVAPMCRAQEEPPEGEELALRDDAAWTHLVVTLQNGRKVSYPRADVKKVEYVRIGGPGSAAGADWMGKTWRVRESAPDGRYCDAVWTRQGKTATFSGHWKCSWGAELSRTVEVKALQGTTVRVFRPDVNNYYEGKLSPDRKSIKGTPKFGSGTWTVKIE